MVVQKSMLVHTSMEHIIVVVHTKVMVQPSRLVHTSVEHIGVMEHISVVVQPSIVVHTIWYSMRPNAQSGGGDASGVGGNVPTSGGAFLLHLCTPGH